MTDLIALMLHLRPYEDATLPGHLGRAAYAQALRWIDNDDPALSKRLHDASEIKPLTCSSLIGARRGGENKRIVNRDDTYFLRLTGFSPDVVRIMQGWLARPPKSVDLDGIHFHLETIICDATLDAWTGQTTYEALAAPYLLARQTAPPRVTLQFSTPTAFRSQGRVMPFALPALVFGSLAARWNAYSPVGISPETRAFCESELLLTQYALRTRALPYKEERHLIGCVGQATYVSQSSDKYWRGVLTILANYAFYGGVGYQTTIGMGQTRLVAQTNHHSVPV